jgi:hypothetical protein
VREEAVRALSTRPGHEYRDLLLAGLRYPWPAVADHAAEVLAALKDRAVVPLLVRLLSEPDPKAPFAIASGNRKGLAILQMVRINHLGNCLLCHAPSFSEGDPVRGAVPLRGKSLGSSPTPQVYQGSTTFVRADVTYLRQDFSVMQTVAEPGPWPVHQRYDYMVQVRRLSTQSAAQYRNRRESPDCYPQRDAVLFALRELTGKDVSSETAPGHDPVPSHRPLPRLAALASSPAIGDWKRFLQPTTQ